ncbi:aminotransferase class I/II-fold pyridoxal phosphate-dependent enzyme [Synechococcales cyanobacterium C]|uniref:Aminotransferase class I/II-fold pyridoxal phosphate-dependent enzyme n=2 Tax=Petrachloros TaxID=2918834 RepID=A0A8K2A040_9CYAN|nr:aminotransferase class I/II-fold pyridoxal phosphate-dependent enzyme [Petrachloros mirabilis ULC683]
MQSEVAHLEARLTLQLATQLPQPLIVTRHSWILACGICPGIQPEDLLGLALGHWYPTTSVQLVDLGTQQRRLTPAIQRSMLRVLRHGQYVLGPEVAALETRLAQFVGVKHCITCANGTDALLIAQMALGIEPGSEVIVPGFTFIATAETVALLGATPVYVDIDPLTYTLDPSQLESAITPRTRAIMPVSLYGQCADFDAIGAIAARYNIPVIEDAAQSLGATYKGRPSGSLSTLACTSFFPSKPLGGYGDGGAIFTDNDQWSEIIRQIANHGQDRRYHHIRLGVNSRLDTLQAAILLAKLDIFPQEIGQRQQVAQRYDVWLQQAGIPPPYIELHNTSVYAQYTLRVPERQALQARLRSAGVPSVVHYPLPLNHQPALLNPKVELPLCNQVAQEVLSLPLHPYLSPEMQAQIIEVFLQG